MTASVSTVLVDLGETLIHPCPPVENQYLSIASRLFPGRSFPEPARVKSRFGRAFEQFYRGRAPGDFGTTMVEGYWFWQRVIGGVFPRLPGPEVVRFTNAAFEHFKRPEAWAFYENSRSELRKLRQLDLRVALLSNWDRRARELISNLGLGKFFDALFISSEVGFHKPDRRIFTAALDQLGQTGERTCMIGNDVEVDLAPARRLGLQTLLFWPGDSSPPDWSPVAASWSEVGDVISREFLA